MISLGEPLVLWKLIYVFLIFIAGCLLLAAIVLDFVRDMGHRGIGSLGVGWLILTAVGIIAALFPWGIMGVLFLQILLFQAAPLPAAIVSSVFLLIAYFAFYDSLSGGRVFFKS